MTETERVARQTRNAVMFIAWVLAIGLMASLVWALMVLTAASSSSYTPSQPAPKVSRLCDVNPTYAC